MEKEIKMNENDLMRKEEKKDTKKINRYRNHQNISSFFFAEKKFPFVSFC